MGIEFKNLFSDKLHQEYKKILLENIPELQSCRHENFYSLIDYYIISPTKYFNQEVAEVFYNYLVSIYNNPKDFNLFIESVDSNFYDLDQAIKGLDEINAKDIHERPLPIQPNQEVEQMYEISNTFLYEYLKINDLVLMGLIKPIAYFLRKRSNKGVDKLDVFNCVETLKTQAQFSIIEKIYNHTLRNSIAHGGIQFNGTTIVFKDRKKQLSYSTSRFLKLFDELIDYVNGITYAYRKFYLLNLYFFEEKNVAIPNSINNKELKIKSSHFGWNLLYSYDSTIQSGKQFNLFVSSTLNSRDFMNLSAYQTAFYLEKLMPDVYDTLFIQIRTKFKMPCWQSFNMHKLRSFINNGVRDIVTDGPYFFDQKIFAKKRDYITIYLNFFKRKKQKQLLKNRYIKFHSNKTYNVIEKHSIVLNNETINNQKEFIKSNIRKLLMSSIKYKNKKSSFLSKEFLLPTKYIRVFIYEKDMRERTFYDSSTNENLLAIIQFNSSKKIKNILPTFGEKEITKFGVICWSKTHPSITNLN